MGSHERRLIVEWDFDRTIEAVIATFLHENFTIRPVDGGDLRHLPVVGDPMRFAVLEGWPPEAEFPRHCTTPPWLGCKICVYELVGSCTLVTATSPGVDNPIFAALEQQMDNALKALAQGRALVVAA
jgi:hypothetical protein